MKRTAATPPYGAPLAIAICSSSGRQLVTVFVLAAVGLIVVLLTHKFLQ